MEYVVETKNVTKHYPNKTACDHINMTIKKGDIYGFIGKNGAGKTTMMKMILGLTNPNEGEIKLFGSTSLNKERRKIGSLIEAPGLYKDCSAFENMKRFSMIYGGTTEEIKSLLKLVGLSDTKGRKAGKFSLGMKQRLGIAIAMLGCPELLVLDEPINGLDPAGIKDIRDTLVRINKEMGVTILVSSHLLDELAKITTTYGIINNGVLVEQIEAAELMERCKTSLSIQVSDVKKAMEVLKENNILEEGYYTVSENIIVLTKNYEHPEQLNQLLVKSDVLVYSLAPSENGFEDYFIERIGR